MVIYSMRTANIAPNAWAIIAFPPIGAKATAFVFAVFALVVTSTAVLATATNGAKTPIASIATINIRIVSSAIVVPPRFVATRWAVTAGSGIAPYT